MVTPDVDGDPGAMREHYRASISNTSIHEAYPGHHLQLALAARHPSLTRAQVSAPEFVEGWGMYSEQMMREQGFDDGPEFRVALATDAIWRAARIVLDVLMHRGEVSIEEAAAFLIEHTGFERPNALAEARRYTYTPTYNLSYLLGKVLLLGLRDEERRRLGAAFSLRGFHDTLLNGGSLPISFHRRALRGEGVSPNARARRRRVLVIPAIDVEKGRSRLVFWPGVSTGIGAPTDRPERIAEHFVSVGAPLIHIVDFEGARNGAPVNIEAIGAIASRVATPLQLAGGLDSPEAIRVAFAAGATRVVATLAIADDPAVLRACLEVAGDWLAVGLDARAGPARGVPWHRAAPPTLRDLLVGARRPGRPAVRAGSRDGRAGDRGDRRAWRGPSMPISSSPAASRISTACAACATRAQRASSSARRSCPGRSTTRPPERLPHELAPPSQAAASRRRRAARAPDPPPGCWIATSRRDDDLERLASTGGLRPAPGVTRREPRGQAAVEPSPEAGAARRRRARSNTGGDRPRDRRGADRRRGPRVRQPVRRGHGQPVGGGTGDARSEPRRRHVSDQPAGRAGRRRRANRDHRDDQGHDRHEDRWRAVADRGRQLRRARRVPLLRRQRVPPARAGRAS